MIQYVNRKKQTYFVKVMPAKNGGKKYSTVKDPSKCIDSELLSEMPDGFEFYETPEDARVFFRKKIHSSITEVEMSILDKVMSKHKSVKHYLLTKEKDAICISIGSFDEEVFKILNVAPNAAWIAAHQSYEKRMRFVKEEGTFEVQRFCYRGSVDDWIPIDYGDNLQKLARQYCPHLGEDSYFDLHL
jgi:hypothetical protein